MHAGNRSRAARGQTQFHGQTPLRSRIAPMEGVCHRRENASVPEFERLLPPLQDSFSDPRETSGMTPIQDFSYRRFVPWLLLFRAMSLAFSFRQLAVAGVALGVLCAGQLTFQRLGWAADQQFDIVNWQFDDAAEPTNARGGSDVLGKLSPLATPWIQVAYSAIAVLVNDSYAGRFQSAMVCLWLVSVWSLFGLALCRLTARRLARNEEGSVRRAIRFGVTRWIYGIVAPALPAAAALVVVVPAIVVAATGRIPWIGATLVVLGSPVILVCSMTAAYLFLAILIGWPLMLAAIATDDCDGFGGLSRSYSLWTGRLWYFAWCWIVAAVVGTVAVLLASWLGRWGLLISDLAIRTGMGESNTEVDAASTVQFLLTILLRMYCLSFFWTSVTIGYVLLRQSVDRLPFDVIAPDDEERPKRDPLPVVGIPAMQIASADSPSMGSTASE